MSRHSNSDNHSNQLNPNNDVYWQSRELDERPDDWEERTREDEAKQQADAEVSKQHR